jgi:hypothetical protein
LEFQSTFNLSTLVRRECRFGGKGRGYLVLEQRKARVAVQEEEQVAAVGGPSMASSWSWSERETRRGSERERRRGEEKGRRDGFVPTIVELLEDGS